MAVPASDSSPRFIVWMMRVAILDALARHASMRRLSSMAMR